MKNKIEKTNLTKFDYVCRRLMIVGLFIFGIGLMVTLPIVNSLSKSNNIMTEQIKKTDRTNNDNTVIIIEQ